ncbi:polysaccharide pyruvyl transferase family protein [Arthrobacter sp. 3Tela_A]|uniref:polysaccharide pyruvyl transferase family protein n=1 Tax=Arthrobacter sp. 3Tela_A TaxID=3093743 RepID=UPI003BB61B70
MEFSGLLEVVADRAAGENAAPWQRIRAGANNLLELHFQSGGHSFTLEIRPAGANAELSVTADTEDSRRVLRNALVGRFPLLQDSGERHLLGVVPLHPADLLAEAGARIRDITQTADAVLDAARPGGEVPPGFLNLLWWDERPNFGDAVGPWLAGRLSGLTPVNGRSLRLGTPALATAGSIAGWLEQDGSQIWGSGLMGPLEGESLARMRCLKNVRVHAVRGRNTRTELQRMTGWHVPEVYGDPALLLPRFLETDGAAPGGGIAVVPHLDHRGSLKSAAVPGITLVDVREGVETVVRQIAAAQVCVSSSLHGIIVAQAYGVPWVWLRVSDRIISGDRYKFEDFFTTLDAGAVSACDVPAAALGPALIGDLAARAALPELRIDLAALLESFPRRRA